MTHNLFREDAYLKECAAAITATGDQGIVLDRSVFYPLGGGQAGDAGVLVLADGREIAIADTRKHKDAEELDANPSLVKSMSVQPPRGTGRIRTIRVGRDEQVDFQPCGGTHVANTAEIGAVVVTKIEKKSAMTRRIILGFAG